MRTVDYSTMIVLYNLVIGILILLASDKIGSIAKRLNDTVGRYVRISTYTLGSCISLLSGSIYVVFHVLRIGMG